MNAELATLTASCFGAGMCLRFICSAMGSLGQNIKSIIKAV